MDVVYNVLVPNKYKHTNEVMHALPPLMDKH